MIKTANIIRSADGTKMLGVLTDSERADFDRLGPYGLQVYSARCVEVGGRLYPLAEGVPSDGVGAWSLAQEEADQEALDAAVLAMPRALADRQFPGHEPWAVRKAKRLADDAEADARAAQAKAEREGLEAERAAAAERRAIAEADAVAKADVDAEAKDDAALAASAASAAKADKATKAAQAAADAAAALAAAQQKRAEADAAKAAHEARA